MGQVVMIRSDGALLVIGGTVLEFDELGAAYTKAASVAYLHALADVFGRVQLAAVGSPEVGRIYRARLDPAKVDVYLLDAPPAAASWRGALSGDLVALRACASLAYGVMEFFPSAGGGLASTHVAAAARRYVVYFGTDPARRWPLAVSRGPRELARAGYHRVSAHLALRCADAVIVRDEVQFRRLDGRAGVYVRRSEPISCLLEPRSTFTPAFRGSCVNLLYVGMLSRRKGLDVLLGAMRLLVAEYAPDGRGLRLEVVGAKDRIGSDGYTIEALRDCAAKYGVSSQVAFSGYVDDAEELRRVYERADIVVVPSRSEGFPRVIEEALVHGRAVIASRLPSVVAALRDGVDVLLVEAGCPIRLAAAIRELSLDEALQARLIENGKRWARRRLLEPAATQHARIMLSIPGARAGSIG